MQDYYEHALTDEQKTWTEWVEQKKFTTVMTLIKEKVLIHKTFVDLLKECTDDNEKRV